MKFRQNLVRYRNSAGWNQAELGLACGWEDAQGRISHYETGKRDPSIDDIYKMADALGIPASALFEEDTAPKTDIAKLFQGLKSIPRDKRSDFIRSVEALSRGFRL